MSKLIGYFMFLIIIMLLFYSTGLIKGTPNANLLALVIHPENVVNTTAWTIISAAIAAAVVAGAAFGSAVMYRTNMVFKASIAALFLTFVPDIIVLYNTLSSEVSAVFGLIICGPLAIISLVILVEWWAGEG